MLATLLFTEDINKSEKELCNVISKLLTLNYNPSKKNHKGDTALSLAKNKSENKGFYYELGELIKRMKEITEIEQKHPNMETINPLSTTSSHLNLGRYS